MYSLKPRTLSLSKINGKYLVLSITLICSMLLQTDSAEAHGSHIGEQEVFRGSISDLDVRVMAIPIVGDVHISIQISYNEDSKIIKEVQVEMAMLKIAESSISDPANNYVIGPVVATVSEQGWFTTVLPITEKGEWETNITLKDDENEYLIEFPLKIHPSGSTNWGMIGILGIVFALATWWAVPTRKSKRKQP